MPRSLTGGYGVIPAYLLARLALDQRLQGQGLRGELLVDAWSGSWPPPGSVEDGWLLPMPSMMRRTPSTAARLRARPRHDAALPQGRHGAGRAQRPAVERRQSGWAGPADEHI